jgi:hypothetical protein
MGLFSEVINSCEQLGDDMLGVLQTKELECVMDTYWLSPDGRLYLIDDSQTWSLELTDAPWPDNVKKVKTGARGKIKPYPVNGAIRFTGPGHGDNYREVVAWFRGGQLKQVLCSGPMFSCSGVDTW